MNIHLTSPLTGEALRLETPEPVKPRATVHVGPNGGLEFREWTGAETFRVVGKYRAWPNMSEAERSKADALASAAKSAKARASSDAQAWREIQRGG